MADDLARLADFIASAADVALKLGFLDGLQKIGKVEGLVSASVKLFLDDDHPWVRREATRYVLQMQKRFTGFEELVDLAINAAHPVDGARYPGRLDFALTYFDLIARNNELSTWKFAKDRLRISPLEQNAIDEFILSESYVFSI